MEEVEVVVCTSQMVTKVTKYEVYLECAGSDCYEKLRTGYRHYSGYYQSHLNVRDLEECQEECGRDQDCRSFSYRLAIAWLDMAGTS